MKQLHKAHDSAAFWIVNQQGKQRKLLMIGDSTNELSKRPNLGSVIGFLVA
jgi:hypothetical protein